MGIMENWFETVYNMGPSEIKMRFAYIGEGISRAVYALDDFYVAKFATCMDGFDQCSLENKIYNQSGKRYGKYLCPVLWHRPGMIVMPRAVPVKAVSPNAQFDIYSLGSGASKDLKQLAKKYNLLFEDILSPSSWGLLNGRPVLIDYGCTN